MLKMVNRKSRILATQLVIGIHFFAFPLPLSHATVTITVGDGSGLPGSQENPVIVNLTNTNDKIKGVQTDVCDEDNHLSCTKCETTERTTGFTCSTNELEDGCCRVLLFSLGGNPIEEGTGPVFTLKYRVSEKTASRECMGLTPERVKVYDDHNQSLEAASMPGKFCFPSSSFSSTTTTVSSASWQRVYGEMWGTRRNKNLSLLRAFRDEVLAESTLGKRSIALFYNNSAEILSLLQNRLLIIRTREVIDEMLPGIQALFEGKSMIVSERTVDNICSLLSQFEIRASPELKGVIKEVRKDMRKRELLRQLMWGSGP